VKVIGVSMVFNEADIVAVNVRYHLALGLDAIWIVDNRSDDGTPDVLQELARDPRVRWRSEPSPVRQSDVMSALAREAHAAGADWVIPIDADEFWSTDGGQLRDILRTSTAGALRAEEINFVQRRTQLRRSPAALLTMTARCPNTYQDPHGERFCAGEISYVELQGLSKLVVRAAPNLSLFQGCHHVDGAPGPIEDCARLRLLHAPIRSRETLDSKAEGGRRARVAGRLPGESWHILRWAGLSAAELDAEWRANSYDTRGLDVGGDIRPLVTDLALRNALAPHVEAGGV
jgi:hypothetical protein